VRFSGKRVFSQDKLRQTVGLCPYSFEEDRREAEERTSQDARPMSRYVIEVRCNPEGFATFSRITLERFPAYAEAVQKMRALLS